jgi:spore coat protein A
LDRASSLDIKTLIGGLVAADQALVQRALDWVSPPAAGATVPVPVATHLHGGDTRSLSDGHPDAWETAVATTPAAYYQSSATFVMPYLYDNAQESGHLWYHDHALGITRTNVYMGLAGLYFLRDANENALRAGTRPVLPSYPYEVPLVIQDRLFDTDGSLFYPDTPMAGTSAVAPSHLPEFFGDVVLVNAQAWPVLAVEPRKYRFRLLNGSDSRFYDLKLVTTANRAGPAITVIGNELGFLDRPAVPSANWVGGPRNVLSIAPGERYDIIVDFTGIRAGTRLLLVNSAAAPYPAGAPITPGTADQVMAFDVSLPLNAAIRNASVANSTNLRGAAALGAVTTRGKTIAATRKILLWEGVDALGRLQTMLGDATPIAPTATPGATNGTMTYKDPVTETPKVGTWEIWEFYNCTVDAHPIHMHLVDFRILNRQAFTFTSVPKAMSDGSEGGALTGVKLARATRAPGAWEAGRKDTVQAFPGEVTRVLVNFKRAGDYVYHCHILSHEDHEMMRPYRVI